MRKILVGVMGPGDSASSKAIAVAYELGTCIAKEGWTTVSGGRSAGVMDAVNKGAKSQSGLTVGILPFADNSHTSEYVDVAIISGMGSARNNIEILSCDALVIVAESMGSGTASEACLALKAKKDIILLLPDEITRKFFENLGKELVHIATTSKIAIEMIKN